MSAANDSEGIEAIIWLQGFAGIKEAKAKAAAGWRSMSDHEKKHTIATYRMLNPKKGKK